jgi:hypothetical protein
MRTIKTHALLLMFFVLLSASSADAAENAPEEWDPSLDVPGVTREDAAGILAPGELKSSVLDQLPDRVRAMAPPIAVIRLRARPDSGGRCDEVEVVQSSGIREIDDAAILACRMEFSWEPPRDAIAAAEWRDVEITFQFQNPATALQVDHQGCLP